MFKDRPDSMLNITHKYTSHYKVNLSYKRFQTKSTLVYSSGEVFIHFMPLYTIIQSYSINGALKRSTFSMCSLGIEAMTLMLL